MAVITLLTDYGIKDHYIATIKAKMLSVNPNLQIIDISHEIEDFNVLHAAFTLKSVYNEFPEGTIHYVDVNASDNKNIGYVAVKMDGHYFVGPDNGIFNLVKGGGQYAIVSLSRPGNLSSFPGKNILAPAVVYLASGKSFYELGQQKEALDPSTPLELKITDAGIAGHIIHVDHYGNLISNIPVEVVESVGGGKKFTVTFGRESSDIMNNHYGEVEGGEVATFFNNIGLLEIAINKGNATQLLGLGYESPVSIVFH